MEIPWDEKPDKALFFKKGRKFACFLRK